MGPPRLAPLSLPASSSASCTTLIRRTSACVQACAFSLSGTAFCALSFGVSGLGVAPSGVGFRV